MSVCMCVIMCDKENQRIRDGTESVSLWLALSRELPEKSSVSRDLNEIQGWTDESSEVTTYEGPKGTERRE